MTQTANKQKNNQIEPMADFFDNRAEGYENHMRGCVNDFSEFYKTISNPILDTDKPLLILDLGCGTGLEIEDIYKKAPNASLVCVDVSKEMLAKLKEKYSALNKTINLIKKSYLTFKYKPNKYDFIVSVMTMHHFEYDVKLKLYSAIRNSLKNGACYIEGDYVVSESEEKNKLDEYFALKKSRPEILDGSYHIDIPFSKETQLELFKVAGFSKVDLIWEKGSDVVFVAYK